MIYQIKTIKVRLKICESKNEQVFTPTDAQKIVQGIFETLDADQEHFILLSLDAKNVVKGYKVITSGGQANANPDLKILFRNALLLGANCIIVAHNHPSGDPEPSEEDIYFTKKVKEASEVLQITFLDHIIIGKNKHWAWSERTGGLQ